jgi:hypothetical protein
MKEAVMADSLSQYGGSHMNKLDQVDLIAGASGGYC